MRIDFPGIDPFLRIAECGGFRRAARAIQRMAFVRAGLPAWLVRGGEVDLHSQVSINPMRARIVNTARERKETIRWLSIRYWQNCRRWITTKRAWAALKPRSSTRDAEDGADLVRLNSIVPGPAMPNPTPKLLKLGWKEPEIAKRRRSTDRGNPEQVHKLRRSRCRQRNDKQWSRHEPSRRRCRAAFRRRQVWVERRNSKSSYRTICFLSKRTSLAGWNAPWMLLVVGPRLARLALAQRCRRSLITSVCTYSVDFAANHHGF